jgi:hypothetical protein
VFLSVPPAPHIPALFPTVTQTFNVTQWGANIRALPSPSLGVVESIEFKKAIQSKQHEYLLVRVHHPDSARRAVFIIHRCPSSVWRPMPSQSTSFPPVTSDMVTISPDGDEEKLVVDQHGMCETLGTLTFPVLRPSVLDLSTLLEVINSHKPFYTVEECKCYWYTGAIFDIMKLEFQARETYSPLATLTRASYKGYVVKSEHATPTLRGEFTSKKELYTRRAAEAVVSSCRF